MYLSQLEEKEQRCLSPIQVAFLRRWEALSDQSVSEFFLWRADRTAFKFIALESSSTIKKKKMSRRKDFLFKIIIIIVL